MNAYLLDVVRILSDIRVTDDRLAAYDSGFGLVIATEAGPAELTFALNRHSARIKPPSQGPTWEADWESAKKLAADFCRAHNASISVR